MRRWVTLISLFNLRYHEFNPRFRQRCASDAGGYRRTVVLPPAPIVRRRRERSIDAARFAAKEAALKALGTGLRHGITWQDVEVRRQPGSRPTIAFSGVAAQFAARLGVKHVSLSLSHTAEQAIAQVILES